MGDDVNLAKVNKDAYIERVLRACTKRMTKKEVGHVEKANLCKRKSTVTPD